MISKSNCQKCGQTFEFDSSEFEESGRTATHVFGQSIDCPFCGNKTVITVEKPIVSEPSKPIPSEERVNESKPGKIAHSRLASIALAILGIILVADSCIDETHSQNGINQVYSGVVYCSGFIILSLAFIADILISITKNQK
jgi:hypothetical protein